MAGKEEAETTITGGGNLHFLKSPRTRDLFVLQGEVHASRSWTYLLSQHFPSITVPSDSGGLTANPKQACSDCHDLGVVCSCRTSAFVSSSQRSGHRERLVALTRRLSCVGHSRQLLRLMATMGKLQTFASQHSLSKRRLQSLVQHYPISRTPKKQFSRSGQGLIFKSPS